jgi:hypothetical protein
LGRFLRGVGVDLVWHGLWLAGNAEFVHSPGYRPTRSKL